MKKRAPPGEANCVVVRHTASDGSKGLHLRAIATMAPGTQLTITSRVNAEIFMLRPYHWFPRRFEEPTEAKYDAMDVDDDNGAAPMLVEPRRAGRGRASRSALLRSCRPKTPTPTTRRPTRSIPISIPMMM